MSPRVIRLRRPATLSVQEGVFVPANHLLGDVEQRWNALREQNPAYYDGRLYHVLGVHRNGHGGCLLHVIDCAYRFFAVQDHSFDLGVRPLGVKGVIEREGRYLIGRRSKHVAAYHDMWEFAPAGSVEPPKSPAEIIQLELLEETGMKTAREPTPIAVLFDPDLRCWEVVFNLEIESGTPSPRTREYSALEWRSLDDLPDELSPVAKQIKALLIER